MRRQPTVAAAGVEVEFVSADGVMQRAWTPQQRQRLYRLGTDAWAQAAA